MAFDPLPLNTAEDAVLVEQKAGTSATVDDGGGSLSVDDNGGSLSVDDGGVSLSTYNKPDYTILSTDAFPTPPAGKEGATLLLTDVGSRYEWTSQQWVQTHLKGAVNIHDADVHTKLVNKFVHQHVTPQTTLTVATAPDDISISVASTAGYAVNDALHINTSSIETTHPLITAIPPTTPAGVLQLDRRLDLVHNIGDSVEKAILDMSTTAGTLASPQIFWSGPAAGEVWHITRLLFEMTHSSAGDLSKFGNLSKLTNGVVLRAYINGSSFTFTNWKSNADIKLDLFDVVFDARSGGGGAYGTTGRGTFKAADAVVRLDGSLGDEFRVYIQDDLTTLDSFRLKIQGHIAEL